MLKGERRSRETASEAHRFQVWLPDRSGTQRRQKLSLSLENELCCRKSRAARALLQVLATQDYSFRCNTDNDPQESRAGRPEPFLLAHTPCWGLGLTWDRVGCGSFSSCRSPFLGMMSLLIYRIIGISQNPLPKDSSENSGSLLWMITEPSFEYLGTKTMETSALIFLLFISLGGLGQCA